MATKPESLKPKKYLAKREAWDNFYFAPEFWVVTAAILGIVAFVRYSDSTPSVLHNELAFQVYGTIGTVAIFVLTNYLLERRQKLVTQGFEPIGYRLQQSFERFGGLELTLFITNIVMLFAVLYGHMWTPKGDYRHLYTGIDFAKAHSSIWILVGINLLAIACAAFGRIFGKRNFLVLAALLAISYVVAFILFVNLMTNTASNSPDPDGIGFTLLITSGLIAVIAPIVAVIVGFRKKSQEQLV